MLTKKVESNMTDIQIESGKSEKTKLQIKPIPQYI
jgi:hypothetical protein